MLGEFYGVAHEIHEDLSQPHQVAAHELGNDRLHVQVECDPFFMARGASSRRAAARATRISKSTGSMASFPASILEKSRMLLRTPSSEFAEILTSSRYSR